MNVISSAGIFIFHKLKYWGEIMKVFDLLMELNEKVFFAIKSKET